MVKESERKRRLVVERATFQSEPSGGGFNGQNLSDPSSGSWKSIHSGEEEQLRFSFHLDLLESNLQLGSRMSEERKRIIRERRRRRGRKRNRLRGAMLVLLFVCH